MKKRVFNCTNWLSSVLIVLVCELVACCWPFVYSKNYISKERRAGTFPATRLESGSARIKFDPSLSRSSLPLEPCSPTAVSVASGLLCTSSAAQHAVSSVKSISTTSLQRRRKDGGFGPLRPIKPYCVRLSLSGQPLQPLRQRETLIYGVVDTQLSATCTKHRVPVAELACCIDAKLP